MNDFFLVNGGDSRDNRDGKVQTGNQAWVIPCKVIFEGNKAFILEIDFIILSVKCQRPADMWTDKRDKHVVFALITND